MRTFFIWLSGLFSSASLGMILASYAPHPYNDGGTMMLGLVAGALGFCCARLWGAAPPKID